MFLTINKFGLKMGKTITFNILKTQVIKKKTFCCDPPLDQKLVFLSCLLKKNIDVEQETQLKIWNTNKDTEMGLE